MNFSNPKRSAKTRGAVLEKQSVRPTIPRTCTPKISGEPQPEHVLNRETRRQLRSRTGAPRARAADKIYNSLRTDCCEDAKMRPYKHQHVPVKKWSMNECPKSAQNATPSRSASEIPTHHQSRPKPKTKSTTSQNQSSTFWYWILLMSCASARQWAHFAASRVAASAKFCSKRRSGFALGQRSLM